MTFLLKRQSGNIDAFRKAQCGNIEFLERHNVEIVTFLERLVAREIELQELNTDIEKLQKKISSYAEWYRGPNKQHIKSFLTCEGSL